MYQSYMQNQIYPNNYNNQFNNQYQQQQLQQQYLMQQQMQPQQYQQPRSNPYCRIINTPEEIRADEVPMDGNVGLFISRDMSKIFVKSWNGMTGAIDTLVFNPVLDEVKENVEESNKNNLEDLQKDIDLFKKEMFERFDKFEKSFNSKPVNSRNKKEAENV